MDWWRYYNANIQLYSSFEARDSKNRSLTKKQFLDSLKTGKYLPVKMKGHLKTYALQNNDTQNEAITAKIKQLSEMIESNFLWEGKRFPNFNFTDLEGNNYTSENTKDKTVFLKTYYISCQACNEEMPKLNKWINNSQNKNRLFISIALDNRVKLKNFLGNKDYKYHFIPDQNHFIEEKLNSNIFPTHFVIEKGIIKKVVNTASELIDYEDGRLT